MEQPLSFSPGTMLYFTVVGFMVNPFDDHITGNCDKNVAQLYLTSQQAMKHIMVDIEIQDRERT